MSNPIAIFETLRETYFRYLDSPFDLRYADLIQERRQLLDRDGRLYRNPLIEPVPAYQSSNDTFRQTVDRLLTATHSQAERDDLAAFVSLGLFPATLPNGQPRELYSHQREAFEYSVLHGKDIVVTTGTGSGKTECFLLPVAAALVRESAIWQAPGARPPQWDWWNYWSMQGSRRRLAPRIPQRVHENRPAAVRALILYPLNALVEDQLARLRDGLDGPQIDVWLQANRDGNRFYFGRYTGRTPVSGNRTSNATSRLRTELASAGRDAQLVAGGPAARFFQNLNGSEMWSRWDMQDHPPDILITNYSMLNIMLMRGVESSIFDQTRQWLSSDKSHVFHLVVDELHTYRGTPGTEVAYLIRVLLDRMGLKPDSTQLRIIASSASVASGAAGEQYLESFFGRDRNHFRIISGTIQPLNPNSFVGVRANAAVLRQLRNNLRLSRGVRDNSNRPFITKWCGSPADGRRCYCRTGVGIWIGACPRSRCSTSCLRLRTSRRAKARTKVSRGNCWENVSGTPHSTRIGSGRGLARRAISRTRGDGKRSTSSASPYYLSKSAGPLDVYQSEMRASSDAERASS